MFSYYLNGFYTKYISENIYLVMFSSGISQLIAYTSSSWIKHHFGTKRSYVFAFSLTSIAGVLLSFFLDDDWHIAIAVFLAMFGVTSGYNISWMAIVDAFPP